MEVGQGCRPWLVTVYTVGESTVRSSSRSSQVRPGDRRGSLSLSRCAREAGDPACPVRPGKGRPSEPQRAHDQPLMVKMLACKMKAGE